MPKKSRAARGGGQNRKPKVQKSVELVRPVVEEQEGKPTSVAVVRARTSTLTVPEVQSKKIGSATNPVTTTTSSARKESGSARLATRRQAAQQRGVASLISAEHYSYVRKDLILIAILAAVMFSMIIILHFVPGIGT